MDYDYYDETRTRFQLQSGPASADLQEEKKEFNLVEVGFCFSVSLLSLGFAWYSQGFLQFSLIWLASALFVGPFAPSSATGGACRVGVGELLPVEQEEEEEPSETENVSVRNSKQRRKGPAVPDAEERVSLTEQNNEGTKLDRVQHYAKENGKLASEDARNGEGDVENDGSSDGDDGAYDYEGDTYQKREVCNGSSTLSDQNCENISKAEAEWTSSDIELMKKLMVKYPRGMLKRWEVIAESFDGLHSVESVVKMSKAMGEKKKGSNDSYSDFLAKRKGQGNAIESPLSQRWDVDKLHMENPKGLEGEEEKASGGNGVADEVRQGQAKKKSEWTEAEDKALLSALKTFPKDTPMRWEKVTLAVPTRTKQQCFRRYTQLKESFRNKPDRS